MVRAAVSGAIDYARYDPTDFNSRLRNKLVLYEIQRREEVLFLSSVHQQWLAYVAHGQLTEDSFANVKTSANSSLDELKWSIFPWRAPDESELKNDTIVDAGTPKLDNDTQKLVQQYKNWQKQLEEAKAAKPPDGGNP